MEESNKPEESEGMQLAQILAAGRAERLLDILIEKFLDSKRNIRCMSLKCVFWRTFGNCGLVHVHIKDGQCRSFTTQEAWERIKGEMHADGVNRLSALNSNDVRHEDLPLLAR